VKAVPDVAVAGPVFVIITSAEAVTLVLVEAELLAVFGSDSLAVTVALLVMVPVVVGVTLIVNVALAPFASEPVTLHVTVPDALVQPGLAELNVTPAGRVSTTLTPVAAPGPLFVATRV